MSKLIQTISSGLKDIFEVFTLELHRIFTDGGVMISAAAAASTATVSIVNVITSVVIFHCFIGYLFTLPEQCLDFAVLTLDDFAPTFLQMATLLDLPHQYGNDNGQHEDDDSENQ